MTVSRRTLLQLGGFALVGVPFVTLAADPFEILMRGNANGSSVWFDPWGLLVAPGTVVRWRNIDSGNSHTATAFHPQNNEHQQRVPAEAKPWNSDYLLPDETFDVTLTIPGVYDYFCIPHEMAGMVGRIVVSEPGAIPPVAATGMTDAFPPVVDILRSGTVQRTM